jgi:hypothetical protein
MDDQYHHRAFALFYSIPPPWAKLAQSQINYGLMLMGLSLSISVYKRDIMLIKTIMAIALLLTINQCAVAISVNEAIGEFRISFEAKDDIDMIVKLWNQTDSGGFFDISEDNPLEPKDVLAVVAANSQNNSDFWSGVIVFIMKKPVWTIDVKNNFFKNASTPYVITYDRIIDNHDGIYALTGDGPKDPNMVRVGLYWLDEAENGTASELIMVICNEAEPVAEMVTDTVHVERLS